MVAFETIDDAVWFLQAAGWSIGEARLLRRGGRANSAVWATRGVEKVHVEADSQTEAWREAARIVAEMVEW